MNLLSLLKNPLSLVQNRLSLPKRCLSLVVFALSLVSAHSAAPTFGQVMWTNDTAKVLLSPERSTNRIQLGTNLVTFGGVSSAFPAMWREGTTLNFRLADNSLFAPIAAGNIRSRSQGMLLDTEDSASIFAYNFLFRKKGNAGGTNNAISAETELGNFGWQGWDGSAYVTGVGFVPKSEQAWVAGVSAGARMELRLSASNQVGFGEAFRFVLATGTNAMMTFNGGGTITAAQPALKRFGRFIQVRSADDTGFADFAVSNINMNGVTYLWTPTQATVPSVATNNGVAGANAIGFWPISAIPTFSALVWTNNGIDIRPVDTAVRGLRQGIVTGDRWDATNIGIGSVAFGSNNLAGGYFSATLSGAQNWIDTNAPFSVIAGGVSNAIVGSVFGAHFIGGGRSNIISSLSSNNVIAGGYGNFTDASSRGASIGGGYSNRVQQIFGTVAGGSGNFSGGSHGAIGGGQGNIAGSTSAADFDTIGGGQLNLIQGGDYGTIGGGETNQVLNNAQWGFIGGGRGNSIDAEGANIPGGARNNVAINSVYSFVMGGASNNVNASVTYGGVVGSWGTNNTSKSVLISPAGAHSPNLLHVTDTATTNLGPLLVRVGRATQWARVPGNLTNAATSIVNAGAAATNLLTYMVLGHTLTNNGDRLTFRASGRFAANGNNKTIQVIWGSELIYDSGAQAANSGSWVVTGEIIRTGSTAQSVNGSYAGTGETLFNLANARDMAQTNGINTLLRVVSTATADGDITNRTFTVDYFPTSL